ncbi:MAG: alanine--glyoxylate aminotransferase family protein [Gemmatimonadota bacterium]|nr:alanine--glyoxylate aminotransferase family protein [Gemmatimonadota bacterium]
MNQPTSEGADTPFGRFFLPGPTEVHPDVLQAQTRAMISHRGAGIQALMRELDDGLQAIFLTKRHVYVSTSSATGLMEAAVRNSGGRKVLSLVNGAFSDRFATIARTNGLDADEYALPWGEAHDPEELRKRLATGEYGTVTVAHSETSTGVLNDIRALAQVVHEFDDVVIMVDSVSGFSATEVRTDEWGIDFLLTGAQKALALPPGLAFGVASERMLARSEESPNKGFYFDFEQFEKNADKFQTPSTPALSVMFALQVQLGRILEEGLDARWARHAKMAERTYAWVDEMREAGLDFSVLAPEGYRSPAVTAIRVPEDVEAPEIVKGMAERGWVIGGGYGKLKPTTFRIGHMGEHTLDELEALLTQLTEVVR